MKRLVLIIVELLIKSKNFLLQKTDPILLVFLLMMLNYRFSFKIIAIIGIFYLRPNFKIKFNGISFFYISIIVLSIVNALVIHPNYSINHLTVVFAGILIWITCLLSYHQIKLAIDNNEPFKIINTLKVIVFLNFLISFYDIINLMIITHTINPYTQFCPPPYGISSGDLIGGVFGEIHLVNTIISFLLTIFFIYQRSILFAFLCLIPFLLTGSNLATLVFVVILIYLLVLKKGIHIKYYATFSIMIVLIFYIKITPDNQKYMIKTISKIKEQFLKKTDLIVSSPSTNQVTLPIKKKRELTKDELIYYFVQHIQKSKKINTIVTTKKESKLILNTISEFQKKKKYILKKDSDNTWLTKESLKLSKLNNPFFEYGKLKTFNLDSAAGKLISFKQTKNHLEKDWKNLLFGSGIGTFSSRLAFITSGIVNDSKILMAIPKYETQDFRDNHKAIFKYLMFLDDETHSITNLPFSWYNQLFGEYGLIGLILFCVAYLGYFIKRFKLLSFGKTLFIAILIFFLFDYWYERLSVTLIFELLMLLDLKIKMFKKQATT